MENQSVVEATETANCVNDALTCCCSDCEARFVAMTEAEKFDARTAKLKAIGAKPYGAR